MKVLYIFLLTGILFTSQSFAQWVALNQSLNTEITSIYKDNATIYIGTKNGGVYSSLQPYMNFSQRNNGISQNRIHCITKVQGKLAAGSYGGGVYFSSDEGNSWTQSLSGMQIPYIFTIQENGNNILAGADKYLYLSDDGGSSWKVSLIINYIFNQIYKSDDKLLVAGGPLLYSSTDDGATWNLVVNAHNTTIICIEEISNQNENYLFVGTLDGVFLSTDNGKKWSTKNNGLAYQHINALATKSNYLFAATERGGVYMTSDFGNNWNELNSGLPQNTSVRAFFVDNNDLYAASSDGIVWKMNLSEVITDVARQEDFLSIMDIFPNPSTDEILINRKTNSSEIYFIEDVYGNVLKELHLKLQSEKIDITNMSSGIYFLRNSISGETFKIVKY